MTAQQEETELKIEFVLKVKTVLASVGVSHYIQSKHKVRFIAVSLKSFFSFLFFLTIGFSNEYHFGTYLRKLLAFC